MKLALGHEGTAPMAETKVGAALRKMKAAKGGMDASADRMVTVAGQVSDATAKMDALTAQVESAELREAEALLAEFGSNFPPAGEEVAPQAKKGFLR